MSSTSTPPTEVEQVPEIPQADKPFYLAILSMIALLIGILVSMYFEANHPDVYKGLWIQVAAIFSPFVMMSWAFYFKDHSA